MKQMRFFYLTIFVGSFLLLPVMAVDTKERKCYTEHNFRTANGPAPHVLWQWMNGCVTKEGITYDLESFRRVGITNVQQFLIGGIEADITDTSVTILSDKWNELMRFSWDECKRLGIDFGTHNCPGWSSSGAPGITPDLSMQKLVWAKTTLSGKGSSGALIHRSEVDARWNYYQDICLVILPKVQITVPQKNVKVLKNALDSKGRLRRALPEGEWEVLRFGHTTTGNKNLTAPISGQGLEVDKMCRKALRKFWELFPAKLIEMAGDHAGNAFKRIELDSYEAGNQTWTPAMAKEFQTRRGYVLYPWLATLAGYVVESPEVSNRFRYDWMRTINQLFAENYFSYMEELIHETPGMEFLFQPYGTGHKNFDNMAIRGIGDIVMSEFWMKPATWGWETLLPVSSNAHVNGKKLVAAEAFTGQPQFAFQTDLADLKKVGDQAFSEGVNLFVLHAAAHQPWPHVKPGMTMGWWGTQFGPSQTWWECGASHWIEYLKRCQLLLQKGLFVADLCFLQLWQQRNTPIPEGYKANVCNDKELMTRFSVQNNQLTLPDGMTYRLLVLPNFPRIELALARKIASLVKEGAVIVGNGFAGSPGLKNYKKENDEVLKISQFLFGDLDANQRPGKGVRNVGKGKVYSGFTPKEALISENISKDMEVLDDEKGISWLHRRDGKSHFYFISNQSGIQNSVRLSFRIQGMQPEIWNPATGEIHNALLWEINGDRTIVSLEMNPMDAYFVVFRHKTTHKSGKLTAISINGKEQIMTNNIVRLHGKTLLQLQEQGSYVMTFSNSKSIQFQHNNPNRIIPLSNHWMVHFEENRGAPEKTHFPQLISYTEHEHKGIKHFSGTATYTKSFTLNTNDLSHQKRLVLDLGVVKNMAEVTVNNRKVATLWFPPFEIDITDFCIQGENVVKIAVTNLWPNRIIGDKYEPDDLNWGEVRTFTHVQPHQVIGRNLQTIPNWVINNTERPSKNRITFSTVDFFSKETPLLPSGLIGPVQITVKEVFDLSNILSEK